MQLPHAGCIQVCCLPSDCLTSHGVAASPAAAPPARLQCTVSTDTARSSPLAGVLGVPRELERLRAVEGRGVPRLAQLLEAAARHCLGRLCRLRLIVAACRENSTAPDSWSSIMRSATMDALTVRLACAACAASFWRATAPALPHGPLTMHRAFCKSEA